MKITYSESKDYLVRPENGLINSMVLKTNIRSKKNKKARYAITNVIMKDLSNIIKEFEKLPYKGYARKRPKHQPTDSYFYIAIQLAKCIMITDALNYHVDPVRMEITGT